MTPQEVIDAVLKASEGMRRPVFRGQANKDWPPHSSAVRRLRVEHGDEVLEDKHKLKDLVNIYHRRHLIEPMDTIVGDTMLGLRRLTALQHHRAATGLLDFTESPLVAIWFACEGEPDADGIVFMVDIGDHNIAMKARAQNYRFERESRILYFEPDRPLGTRITAQQSILIVCNPVLPETQIAKERIPKEVKNSMRIHLDRLGISNRMLFADIPGLAAANTVRTPLPKQLTSRELRRRGNQNYQQGQLAEALKDYEEYVHLCPNIAESHALRGDALAASGRYHEAIKAYTTAIENISRPIEVEKNVTLSPSVRKRMQHRIHYNRGNARSAVEEHDKAVEDFDKALTHGNELARDILYNRGNSKFALGLFDEAWDDFDAAREIREGSDTLLAMGNCKVMLGKFDEAKRSYENGLNLSPTGAGTHCQKNSSELAKIQKALGKEPFTWRHDRNTLYIRSEVVGSEERFPFAGNQGNTGNSPSGTETAWGGEGYGGAPGFSVVLRQFRENLRP